jgi:hypothetical protein
MMRKQFTEYFSTRKSTEILTTKWNYFCTMRSIYRFLNWLSEESLPYWHNSIRIDWKHQRYDLDTDHTQKFTSDDLNVEIDCNCPHQIDLKSSHYMWGWTNSWFIRHLATFDPAFSCGATSDNKWKTWEFNWIFRLSVRRWWHLSMLHVANSEICNNILLFWFTSSRMQLTI